jgi:hypothetical protein
MERGDFKPGAVLEVDSLDKSAAVQQEVGILQEAATVTAEKADQYGPPLEHFQRVSEAWQAILNTRVEPQHVILCMIALKLIRQEFKPKRDNIVDIAGYANLLSRF